MPQDDEEARKREARAKQIRADIQNLKTRGPARPAGPASPRDLIEERMRELDRKKD